ncbi:MAG: LLM class flavin-dependent oxidoreductase [Phaeodactylibacter xiamenensis]|uniref:Alkanesulfonate monooxygenase n=1 Tax=Phaeodactylibacter xiamenensis TaxID=1524460 RepID=A0A098SBE4_9BACT|nr:LLM class flavin-dependent oxidoreductase [Phaeodactylibacter xiamenensis]KGE89470.1 alkanesulfonate monooxygenase [Phaeodactylibacter xiamenensis]MCR9053107.1 LLM class flavin-dependent oxidoreductase [bacterium]
MSINVRSRHLEGAEVAWFAPLCNGDDEFLSRHDFRYKSNWSNTSNVLLTTDRLGYRNILCPSSYQVGQDVWTFASAVAPLTQQINILTAIRCGELHPPMLARSIATLDHILRGRLTINIISSNMPGEELESAARYQRSREVIEILKQCWTQDHIDFKGEFYNIQLPTTEPVKPYQQNGGPLLYFGGYSPPGVDLCAEHCDVYLMWPETEDKLQQLMQNMSDKAAGYDREVDFGLRVHVIVRETEAEARAAARRLMTYVDDQRGEEIRLRAQDGKSYGVSRQTAVREQADDEGFVEDHLWTGIGRARSGCGAAIVGDPDQVLAKIQRYVDMGIRAFIFSGYPHLDECNLFGRYVLPRIKTFSMPVVQGRQPMGMPGTPLGAGARG